MSQPSNGGSWWRRLVGWWLRRSLKAKIGIVVGVVALIIIGNLTEPEESGPAAARPTPAPASPAATHDPEPSTSKPPRCNGSGEPPAAPEVSGPVEHVTLGKLTCRFESNGKLDEAQVPVFIRNKGENAADYEVTVHLLDSSNGVIKTGEASASMLEPGAEEQTSAQLVGWGEIETDGRGYRVRISAVEREAEQDPEPLPIDDVSDAIGGSTGSDVDNGDNGDMNVGEVHPGGFCGTPGAVGRANGRTYTCRDGHWRR